MAGRSRSFAFDILSQSILRGHKGQPPVARKQLNLGRLPRARQAQGRIRADVQNRNSRAISPVITNELTLKSGSQPLQKTVFREHPDYLEDSRRPAQRYAPSSRVH